MKMSKKRPQNLPKQIQNKFEMKKKINKRAFLIPKIWLLKNLWRISLSTNSEIFRRGSIHVLYVALAKREILKNRMKCLQIYTLHWARAKGDYFWKISGGIDSVRIQYQRKEAVPTYIPPPI